jgi:hypothetical protein
VPALGVTDGVGEHLAQRLRAVVAQQEQPGVERPGHGGRERPGAWHQVEAERGVVVDGRARRRRSLSTQDPRCLPGGREDHRHLTGGTVEVRLHDVQHEGGRDRRVEGVAVVLQHRHGAGRGQPVRGRHHAERALQGRPRGEHPPSIAVTW